MIYLITSCLLIILFMLYPKNNNKTELFSSLGMTIIAYQCYLCMNAGIMSLVNIPVTIYSISAINIIVILIMFFKIYKTNKTQKYYWSFLDLSFMIVLIVSIIIIFLKRFSMNIDIVFETSDPGPHLKFAMDFINNNKVGPMYFGALINGLFIESMDLFYNGAFVYKSFIMNYGLNLFFSGLIFFSALRKYSKNIAVRILMYITTLTYILGYPYNDFLFGFVYLQMTITVICYIFLVMKDYLYEPVNKPLFLYLISIGCVTVSMGYTLFTPVVYISVTFCIIYKFYNEYKLKRGLKNKYFINFLKEILQIFLIPVFLTCWYLLINSRLGNSDTTYTQMLAVEGYIYRNLYSDFLLFIIPAVLGVIYSFKNKTINLFSFLLPIIFLYYMFFLYAMLNDKVSTYYFYKINYCMWMIILSLFIIGMSYLYEKEKYLFACIVIFNLTMSVLFISRFEINNSLKNINYMPYTDSSAFFRINEYNYIIYKKRSQVSGDLVKIADKVNNINTDKQVIYIGYWLDLYWFEALTNERLSNEFRFLNKEDIFNKFLNGEYGDYAVISKGEEGIKDINYSSNKIEMVYYNDYGVILKLKNNNF